MPRITNIIEYGGSLDIKPNVWSFVYVGPVHNFFNVPMAKICFSMYLSSHPGFILAYLLHLLHSIAATKNLPAYTPTDLILLNCGTYSSTTSPNGRSWDGDGRSKFLASSTPQASSPAIAAEQQPSVSYVPYMTARVIHSALSYTFPVLPGPKFLRLYFYPSTYSNLSTSESFFSLTANNHTLLSNFSAYLTVSAMEPASASFVKEFIIPVRDNQMLNITFIPSPGSFAFINGIEIVSLPNDLYGSGKDEVLTFVGFDQSFYLENFPAFETLYRLNVGGGVISVLEDTGMYRTWLQDSDYIYAQQFGTTPLPGPDKIVYTNNTPAYTAPELVYKTMRSMGVNPEINENYNLTWYFSVDAGFIYLVRLHFCETRKLVRKTNEVVFFIFINNQTAEQEADVIQWSGNNSTPVYKDYVVWVPEGISSLWLALTPNLRSKPSYADAFLNGLEIFKLNKSDGSLAGRNPEPVAFPGSPGQDLILHDGTNGKRTLPLVIAIGAVIAALFAFSVVFFFFAHQRRKKMQASGPSTQKSALPTELCRQFTIAEIRAATGNFDEQNLIGVGGFGNVYRGYHESASIPIAIKRLNSSSEQGIKEFHTEIEMLSRLWHVHLVPLIGYCDDQGEMILVYEYMPNGALKDHLYKTDSPSLPWKRRLEICIGAARGLHYLHSGTKHTIIHRDIKPTNILLDENWVAKVSDFGLSKIGPTSMSQTHVSTIVKGSFGYIDPEYSRRQLLTEKSDVYSFGVVLLEVLCARRPLIPSLPKDQVNLAEWGRNCYQRGTLDQIIDPYLKGEVAPECLKKFGEICYNCLHDIGSERPTMVDVLWGLEFALQLQEAAEKNKKDPDRVDFNQEIPLLPRGEAVTSGDDDDPFSGSRITLGTSGTSTTLSDPDGARPGAVFSEIMNSVGR